MSDERSSTGAPRVSVVIPVYNLRRYVGEAIDSVLSQTLPPEAVEVVVVDDGSTDGSGEVVRRYGPRVRYLRQENRGLSAARNAGIRASRGPFLMFLDADDRILAGKLAAQLAMFAARPDLALVYTGFHYVDESGARLPQRGWSRLEGDLLPELVLGNRIHVFQALVRREPVEHVGGFDERLTAVEDWDLWLRISRAGVRWACIDEALAEYRIRSDAMHRDAGRMAENCVRVLDKFFADPDLPAEVARLRPLAYHTADLAAAASHYRTGDRVGGARWFLGAATALPTFLTDSEILRAFCLRLLPVGYQRGAVMAQEWRTLAAILDAALRDLFATPQLDPVIGRLAWRARLAAWRAIVPLVGRRVKTILRRRHKPTAVDVRG